MDVAKLRYVLLPHRPPKPSKTKMMEETKRNVQLVLNRDDLKWMVTEWIQEELAKHTQKEETYISRTKAALKLGVTLSTLWRWDKENYLNAVRVGSKVLYKETDIQKVINQTKED